MGDLNENELYLVYVNHVGIDSGGFNTYEFMFSDTTFDIEPIDGDWDVVPACIANVTPPSDENIKLIAILKVYYIELMLAQQSTSFNMWDVMEDLLPLAWENKSIYQEYPSELLLFRFGETLSSINTKLSVWNASNKRGDLKRNEQFLQLKY